MVDTVEAMVDIAARGRLRLLLLLSRKQLLPTVVDTTVDTVEAMVDTVARGRLRPRPTVDMVDTMVDTVEAMVDIAARGRLGLLLLLSLRQLLPTVVDTTVDTVEAMVDTAAMVDTVVATVADMVDIVARGRLRPTVPMVDTVVDMEATEALVTEDKQQYFLLN